MVGPTPRIADAQRRGRRATAVVVALVLLTSLVLLDACRKPAMKYSHPVHETKMQLPCLMCHGAADEAGVMPAMSMQRCTSCHPADLEAPDEGCLKCHRGRTPEKMITTPRPRRPTRWPTGTGPVMLRWRR